MGVVALIFIYFVTEGYRGLQRVLKEWKSELFLDFKGVYLVP